MNSKEMLQCLRKAGFTELSIAIHVNAHQSTISRLLSGKIRDPRSSLCLAIKQMFEKEIDARTLKKKIMSTYR